MSQITRMGICCDHAGYEMKELVVAHLRSRGIECKDFGAYSEDRVDYPDYAHALGSAIDRGEESYGIALCGSGNGISMALNKHSKVRAALCWSAELAALARQHNDANVLSIPARFLTEEEMKSIVDAFLEAEFKGGRHTPRVEKIPL